MDKLRCIVFLVLLAFTSFHEGFGFEIIQGPANTAIGPGNNIKLLCKVADKGKEELNWFRMDTNTIISSETRILKRPRKRFHIVGNQDLGEYHLLIQDVRREDSGMYACGALSLDEARRIFSISAQLAVVLPPVCTMEATHPVQPGVTIRLSCHSQNPGLGVHLSWHRPTQPDQVIYGREETNGTTNTVSNRWNITLGPTDYGESFVCKEDSANPAFRRGCTITPLERNMPVILFPKKSQTVEGQNATFTCIIASKNSPTYEWFINGHIDVHARSERYVFSPVVLAHNGTNVECRIRDITGMTGNASSVLYVYPANISPVTANTEATALEPRIRLYYGRPTTLQTTGDLPYTSTTQRTTTHNSETATTQVNATQSTSKGSLTTTSVMSSTSNTPTNMSFPPLNVMNRPYDETPETAGVSKWSEMMIPVLAVGSIIAVLLILVIVVLLLFIVRQNRVAHGSTDGKDDNNRNDIALDVVKRQDSDTSTSYRSPKPVEFVDDENDDDDDDGDLQPMYFTLEPGKRKVRRLERTASHTIISNTKTHYDVLCRNGSLRRPVRVAMNDYARPGSQLSICDTDASTVSAYAVTDVTLTRGQTSLRRSASCRRPLPAAPVQALNERSHYSIPKDPYMTPVNHGESDATRPRSTIAANRGSRIITPFVPRDDEYAEIDLPHYSQTPGSTDSSRQSSPKMLRGSPVKSLQDAANSFTNSYESGYEAASSDDVMDCDSTSPYASIDAPSNRPSTSSADKQHYVQVDIESDKTTPETSSQNTKPIPVYAKVMKNRSVCDGRNDTTSDTQTDTTLEVAC